MDWLDRLTAALLGISLASLLLVWPHPNPVGLVLVILPQVGYWGFFNWARGHHPFR